MKQTNCDFPEEFVLPLFKHHHHLMKDAHYILVVYFLKAVLYLFKK